MYNYPKAWVGGFTIKFGLSVIANDASRHELLEFCRSFEHECENKSLCEARQICGASMSGTRIGHIS